MRRSLWVLLLVVAVLLAACGGAAKPNVSPQTPGGQLFMLALPRVVVDLDQEGRASVFGVKLSDLGFLLGPEVAQPLLDKATLDQLTGAGVQNIQVRQSGGALELLVNGKLMPHITWDDESLAAAGQLASLANAGSAETLARVLPIIRRLGVDVVLNLPRAPGVAAIPPVEGPIQAPSVPISTTPTAFVRLEVTYDEQGNPSVLGLTPAEVGALGINLPGTISPNTIQELMANDVQSMEIRTRPSGLTVYANNQPLPSFQWDQEMLSNVVDLYTKMYPGQPYDELIKMSPPFVSGADVDILLHFPKSANRPEIPAKLHE